MGELRHLVQRLQRSRAGRIIGRGRDRAGRGIARVRGRVGRTIVVVRERSAVRVSVRGMVRGPRRELGEERVDGGKKRGCCESAGEAWWLRRRLRTKICGKIVPPGCDGALDSGGVERM